MSSSCNCPKPCRQVVFEPFLSNAALSKLSVQQLLSNDLKPLKNKFTKAYETSQRVSTETFIQDISRLDQVLNDFVQFIQLTGQYLENVEQSSFDKAWRSAKRLISLFEHDEKKYLEGIDKLVKDYNNEYRQGDIILSAQLEGMKIGLLEVLQYLQFRTVTSDEPSSNLFSTTVREALIKSERIVQTLNVIYDKRWSVPSSGDDIRVSWNIDTGSKNCSDEVIDLRKDLYSIQVLLEEFSSPSFSLNHSNANIVNSFKSNTSYLINLSENVGTCLTEYITAITALSTFASTAMNDLTQLTNNQNNFLLDSSYNYKDEVGNIDANIKMLNETTQKYIQARIKKGKMLEIFSGEVGRGGMLENVRLFKDKLLQRVTIPLQARISDIEKKLKTKYKEMLSLSAKTETYFKKGYFYSAAEKMIIWKGIAPNFENPANIKQEGKELVSLWIRGTPISEFQRTKGNTFIDETITSFMNQLDKILEDFEAQVKSKTNILENSVNLLSTEYQTYKKTVEINDQFVL